MAITNGDLYIAAAKQMLPFMKSGSITTVANTLFSIFSQAGNPGAGTLAMAANPGTVPDDTVAGYPSLNAFGGGNTGYLTRVAYASSVPCRMYLFDRLWGMTFVLTTLTTITVTSPPSYSARVPGGTDFSGLKIFLEVTTAVSATATTVTVTYTNQAGVTGHTTGATASLSGFIAGRMLELPLAAGDTGVQKIESIVVGGTVATTGVMNVFIARPLWTGRVMIANAGDVHGIDRMGMPQVFATSALFLAVATDGTASGLPELLYEVANG
jgi:hypothetical protein